jgi:hypothetical protein
MKTIIVAIITTIVSSNSYAIGFSPWPDPNDTETGRSTSPATTATVSFYSAGLPLKTGRLDEHQKVITIVPYYLASR